MPTWNPLLYILILLSWISLNCRLNSIISQAFDEYKVISVSVHFSLPMESLTSVVTCLDWSSIKGWSGKSFNTMHCTVASVLMCLSLYAWVCVCVCVAACVSSITEWINDINIRDRVSVWGSGCSGATLHALSIHFEWPSTCVTRRSRLHLIMSHLLTVLHCTVFKTIVIIFIIFRTLIFATGYSLLRCIISLCQIQHNKQ